MAWPCRDWGSTRKPPSSSAAPFELRPDDAAAHNNLGIALRELKKLDEALDHFRRAVELAPDFAPARTNLGQMLLDSGTGGGGPAALPGGGPLAARLGPDAPQPGQHAPRAGTARRGPVGLPGGHPAGPQPGQVPCPPRARSCNKKGQLDDALVWLKQAVELDQARRRSGRTWPSSTPNGRNRPRPSPVGSGRWPCQPERAAAHNGLGWALQEEGRLAEAESHYRTALRCSPTWPLPRLRLGGLKEELGELAEAEAAFREALRLQPQYAVPHARLATLLRGKLPDADLAALEQRLADAELGEGPRARLLFALAHVLDARGDYARAADCLRQANALTLEHARASEARVCPGRARAFRRCA